MRVSGPNGVSGYGQGPQGADRSNRDGQRKQQGKDEPKKQPEETDEVELHKPEAGTPKAPPVARAMPQPPKGKQPPLDLSA